MKPFGARLKAERERLGLTQAAFAAACGVGKTAQYMYERGEREPGFSYFEAARALGVDTLYVTNGTREGSDWAYARAYKKVLQMTALLLALDDSQLDRLASLAMEKEAEFDATGRVELYSFADEIQAWIHASKRPEQFIDLGLLSKIIEQVEIAKSQHPGLSAAKQGEVIATLYRAMKASGKLDPQLIASTVALAST